MCRCLRLRFRTRFWRGARQLLRLQARNARWPPLNLCAKVTAIVVASGIEGFYVSCALRAAHFMGFVRDQYTTLPEIKNRPLHMWLDLDWAYTSSPPAAFSLKAWSELQSARDRSRGLSGLRISGSIQQIIYQIGEKMLADIPMIAEIHLEANNRTWDTIAEADLALGVYTDARPPLR